jgi:hypothetical protein
MGPKRAFRGSNLRNFTDLNIVIPYNGNTLVMLRRPTLLPTRRVLVVCNVVVFSWAVLACCNSKNDDQLRVLLQKGIEHGYPGVAMLIQSGTVRLAPPLSASNHSLLGSRSRLCYAIKWLMVFATLQSAATNSISTSASFGSPATCTVERAGAATGKYFA